MFNAQIQSPRVAKIIMSLLFVIDLFATSLIFCGLSRFRQHELCLLEYSDALYEPGQQTQITVLTFILIGLLKPPELIALTCFICEQNHLIAKGETRSKGVRRSEAFCTPMNSRANSYQLGKVTDTDSLGFQQMNSDDEEDGDEDDIKFFIREGKCHVIDIDIDLNENDNSIEQSRIDDGDAEVAENMNGKFVKRFFKMKQQYNN